MTTSPQDASGTTQGSCPAPSSAGATSAPRPRLARADAQGPVAAPYHPRLYLPCAVAAAITVAPALALVLASHFSPPPAVVLAALQLKVHQVLEPGVAW